MRTEHPGDRGEHPRLIGDLEVQVVLRRGIVDRPDRNRRERADGGARPLAEVRGGIDEIAEHCARGREPPGAPSVEHEVADGLAFDEHGVVALAHAGERMAHRHHRRMHADTDGIVDPLDDRQQLHDVAEPFRVRDVGLGDAADSFVVHVAGDDLRAEGDRGDDRRLGSRVETFHVGRWIALRIAKALRLGQRVAIRHTLLGHAREDVVGRAVDDAHHTSDAFAGERFSQWPDQRDAPGDGRFEEQVDTGVVRGAEQLGADVGEQFLVGRDHGLARFERLGDERSRRLDAADDFDDDVDVRIADDGRRIGRENTFGQAHTALPRGAAHRHGDHLEVQPGTRLDVGAVALQQLDERATDVPAPENPDPHRLAHTAQTVDGAGRGPRWVTA